MSGFAFHPGGLNNQKLALFGLLLRGREDGGAVVLPDFCSLDHRAGTVTRLPLDRVLEVARLRAFGVRHGVLIAGGAAEGEAGGWREFEYGGAHLGRLHREGVLGADGFAREAFAAMTPRVARSALTARIVSGLFGTGRAEGVVQMRIERDWAEHIRLHLGTALPLGLEEYAPTHARIVDKIAATPSLPRRWLVVCDEDDLPVSKDAIRADAAARHGMALWWKSDVLSSGEWAGLSALERSMIDFHLAGVPPVFVGTSRSSFSNMVTMEKAWASAGAVEHFIYNGLGEQVLRRRDRGTCPDAASAVA